MGGLLHLIDLKQSRMARKVVTDKRHGGGLEAPRNSLELPVETCQIYCAVEDNEPYTHQVTEEWSEKTSYPTQAPMKKLISEEISKRPSTRHNSLSIVARLMGVDMLPLDTKPVTQQAEKKNEKSVTKIPKDKQSKNGSVHHILYSSKSSTKTKPDCFDCNEGRDPDQWSDNTKLEKPRSREHPQEEELQKFKKEFEAWQAARLKECSKVVELGTHPSQWIAQENLNREKMVLYANSARMTLSEKPKELAGHFVKSSLHEGGGLQHYWSKEELSPSERRESFSSRSRSSSRDITDEKQAISSGPTRIVILRPGPDNIGNNDESQASSSGTSEERGNMEDFLEEVKERLKCELQGKSLRRGAMVRGGGIETPYSERPTDPKQIAQRIAKQVRDSVTRDLGTNLLRSESTRSYRSEIQYNGAGSPEFISRDTRKFLSERLRNVLKRETDAIPDVPLDVHDSSRSPMLDTVRGRLRRSRHINAGNKDISHWDSVKDEQDMQSRSFRCEPDDDVILHQELSPRNLIRSMSAPVSGTSFGKLLLEDRHILTGAHIRRKHESIERDTVKVKKQKKEKFNLREKVSNFKYSLTLRGKLFGRKIQSMEESLNTERYLLKDIRSGPTVIMNFNNRYENSTEVPPSPASVCSSVHEEFWRSADHLNPTTSDVNSLEDDSVPQVFREISSNLNELRRQLNQLETDGSEEILTQEWPLEAELVELEDQTEAYIRDLLVASGFYDGSSDRSLSRWDPFAKPISNRVFEQVVESYRKKTDYNEGSTQEHCDMMDHKMLLDLLNEALSTVLGPPMSMSNFRKKAIGTMLRPPYGRKLLDRVWEIIREYIYPPAYKSYYSLDDMVALDLLSAPWSGLMNDDIDALGKEMGSQITVDLIDEMVMDMWS